MLSQPGREYGLLLLIVAIGLLLRIYRLGYQSLWHDESLSVTQSLLPAGEMIGVLIQEFYHPPLYFALLNIWFRLFGMGDVQARLISVIFGTLAVAVIYVLARYLFGRQVGFLSALLLAISQLGIMYSQEARPYAQLLFLVLCSVYLFVIALRERRALAWWGFVCASALTIYTHYYGAFAVGFLFLYAALNRRRYALPATWWLGGPLLASIAYLPWLASGVIGYALRSPEPMPDRQPLWFAVRWRTIIDTMSMFNNSRSVGVTVPAPRWALLSGVILFTVPGLIALKSLIPGLKANSGERSDRGSLLLLSILWLLPILVALGLGAVLHLEYDPRLVIFSVFPYYVLVARGITRLNSPRMRQVLVALIVVFSALSLRANYFVPYKENYRDALAYLAREHREADCSIFLPFNEPPLQWSIYHGDGPALRVADLDAVVSGQIRCERVWLVLYRRTLGTSRIGDEGEKTLQVTHQKVDERHYFWIRVGLYTPLRSEM